jgi:ADP-ribosylglycohydrolase/predicted enzyme related to lactoylglutathione lyase
MSDSETTLKPSMQRKTTTSPDRAIAAFLGAAIGDALGWPFEGRADGAPNPRDWDGKFLAWKKRSGSRFALWWEQVKPGEYSDDTQLILAVARARVTGEEWWNNFARVELPFWTCYERGGGGATKRAANSWLNGVAPWDSSAKDVAARYFEAGGNGAAMRVLPHCVAHASDNDFSGLSADVLADSVTTHGHPRALVGALIFAYIVWSAFKRVGVLEYAHLIRLCLDDVSVWGELPDISHRWPSWLAAAEAHTRDFPQVWTSTVEEVTTLCRRASAGLAAGVLSDDLAVLKELGGLSPKTNGSGTTTAISAIYFASRYAASPMEGVRRAACAVGADTDTLASMCASLLGAINGSSWLQPSRDQIQDAEYIRLTAEGLVFRHSVGTTWSRVGRRDISDIVSRLREWGAEPEIEIPIGLRVTSVVREIEDRGGRAVEKLHVSTSTGLTLQINGGSVAKLENHSPESAGGIINDAEFEPSVGMSLSVRNLEQSRKFYEEHLGLKVTGASLKVVRFSLSLALKEDREAAPSCNGIKIFVNVADVEACVRRLLDAGMELPEIVSRGNSRSFECRDPSGYVVEVFERNGTDS